MQFSLPGGANLDALPVAALQDQKMKCYHINFFIVSTCAGQISTQSMLEKRELFLKLRSISGCKKTVPPEGETPAGPGSCCLWLDERVHMESLCVLDILTHAALISYINGLLQVNDRPCEGPFTQNMDGVKTGWESRCCCRGEAHNAAIWLR